MEEAATLRMAQLARERRGHGKDVLDLTVGEPDFDTPLFIKEAAKTALDQGFTKYTPVPGLPDLRRAICRKLQRDNGLDYAPENIVVSTGAKHSLTNICLALLNPGDEVILLSPYWVSYLGMVRLAGATPVFVEAGVDQDFKVTPDQLRQAISSKTRLIVFNSPCNPTGSVYSAGELQSLAGEVVRHEGVYVISDEIYEHITFETPHVSLATMPGLWERTITVNGMSKGFAMTGWRIGYLAGPEWLAKAVTKIQGQFTSGANAFAQKASVAALDGDLTETVLMRDSYRARRELVRELLMQIPGLKVNNPQGAFYIFPDASAYMKNKTIRNSVDLCEYLLNDASVAVVPGIAFGDDRCFRVSFAASEQVLTGGIRRIGKALTRLTQHQISL
ncbi:MAG: pyridoxal phosphate-dependent aminotransferase [Acidobacteria bacterium]|nr:pyridoxal phosphate-dependent aminotransferase [Acidobacteriota bacterium]